MRISDWSSDVCSSDLAYEGGVKATFLDRKVRLNTAAFYYDFQDIQLSAFVSGQPQTLRNAARAKISGIEVALEVAPTSRLRLSGSEEWLNARYTSFHGAPGKFGRASVREGVSR